MELIERIKTGINSSKITPEDITLCYAIRSSEITPWIIKRLEFALTFYSPMPNILVVDFGSEEPFKDKIKNTCLKNNANHIYVNDNGVFSLSKARNIAFKKTQTEFVFFADIDFVYESDIFYKLAKIAERLNLKKNPKKVITMPIFHIGKEETEAFESAKSIDEKDRIIAKWSFDGLVTEFGKKFEFIAPYSNSFFMHKSMFDMAGGYCDEFRGHGSEDFDFMIRLAKLATNIPSPKGLDKDFYGPLKSSFWGKKDYIGFRRYLEALAMPSESLGLKAFHLWHEKPSAKGYWTQSNDWKRERFNNVLSRYSEHDSKLLNVDYLRRDKKALCIFSDKEQWGYFLPLRMANYQLVSLTDKSDIAIADALKSVEDKKFDRVFIFNPYMKSHSAFRGVIELARRIGIAITVIERGGLPNSIYYSDEVAYGDSDYVKIHERLENIDFTSEQLNATKEVLAKLKSGNSTLEKMESYATTWKKHTLLRHIDKRKIFIPLQLRDDMAVNYFIEGYPSYDEYEGQIESSVEKNPNILFIIKQHPLSKYDLSWTSKHENVVLSSQEENIHALIDISDAIHLYNSGVGLLALAHQKPLFHVGNAYYNSENALATRVQNLDNTIKVFSENAQTFANLDKIEKFFAWLIFEKYSWFNADDVIKNFDDRKAHGYKNISVEILNLDKKIYFTGSAMSGYSYSSKSYLNWRVEAGSVSLTNEKANTPVVGMKKSVLESPPQTPIKLLGSEKPLIYPQKITIAGRIILPIISTFLKKNKRIKLKKSPGDFFEDSKHNSLKFVGWLSIKKATNTALKNKNET